jgi:hypothetical protein
MGHYVCTGGCGMVSDVPGTCQANDCIKYHTPLTVCYCTDGAHQEAFENPNAIATEEQTREM